MIVPNTYLSKIPTYIGGDVTPKGMMRRIALSSNENPLGPSNKVVEVLTSSLASINCYPSSASINLREALSTCYNLEIDRIFCGNGSEEIIYLLAQAYAHIESEVIFSKYSFALYNIATLRVGARPIIIPQSLPDLEFHLDEVLKHITSKTKIIFLDNPGNPVGRYHPKQQLVEFLNKIPSNILVVLDAAYAEFVNRSDYSSGIELVSDYPNIVVLRTFSKIYALAGLRLGWAYTSKDIVATVNSIRTPFNVNSLAHIAAIQALHDTDHINKTLSYVSYWRGWLEEKMTKLGLKVIPSYTNFILVMFPSSFRSALSAYKYLGERGIIVRNLDGYNLSNYLRISIGLQEEMEELIYHLEQFLK